MLKMILDPMGGILLTNDGNAILREIEVGHPAAKSMIELSRTQDEEVGDGTTSVIILGEFVEVCGEKFIQLTSIYLLYSGRNSCSFATFTRTKYTPRRHNFRIQEGLGRSSFHH